MTIGRWRAQQQGYSACGRPASLQPLPPTFAPVAVQPSTPPPVPPSFADLQAAAGADPNLVYYSFDLLHLDGEDLAVLPLLERKARLEAVQRQRQPQRVAIAPPSCVQALGLEATVPDFIDRLTGREGRASPVR